LCNTGGNKREGEKGEERRRDLFVVRRQVVHSISLITDANDYLYKRGKGRLGRRLNGRYMYTHMRLHTHTTTIQPNQTNMNVQKTDIQKQVYF
jgi:hypothetical protein